MPLLIYIIKKPTVALLALGLGALVLFLSCGKKPLTYFIAGNVYGLDASNRIQITDGYESQQINTSGGFSFKHEYNQYASYNVLVTAYPDQQFCYTGNLSGVVDRIVANLSIHCGFLPVYTGSFGPVTDFAMNPSGQKLVITSADRSVFYWDTNSQYTGPDFSDSTAMDVVALSSDNVQIAMANGYGGLRIFSLGSSTWLHDGTYTDTPNLSYKPLAHMEFNSANTLLYFGGNDGSLYKWDAVNATPDGVLPITGGPINSFNLHPNGLVALVARTGGIGLVQINTASGDTTGVTGAGNTGYNYVRYSPDALYFAAADANGNLAYGFASSDTSFATITQTLPKLGGLNSKITGMAFRDDGAKIFWADAGGMIGEWDPIAQTQSALFTLPFSISHLEKYPGGPYLIASGSDWTLRILQYETTNDSTVAVSYAP